MLRDDHPTLRLPRRLRRQLLAALAAVTLVAICVRIPLLGTTYTAPDSADYLAQAEALFVHGLTSNLHPPAYPVLLAVFEQLGANPAGAAVVLQNVIGIFMPAFVLLAGWRFFGLGPGVVAGFLAAASPLTFAIEQFALTDYLFSVVLFVATAVLAEAMLRLRRDRVPWTFLALAGALFGLATLLRPNGLYALLAIPIALLLAGPRWKPALRGSAIAGGALVVVIAPWCLYGLIRFDDPNVAGEGGLSLYGRVISYDGVQPPASSEAGRLAREIYNSADPNRVEATVPTTIPVYEALRSQLGLGQSEAIGAMGEIGREAIERDPGTYLSGTVDILGRYQGTYYPRTLAPEQGGDQVSLATGYATLLDSKHQPPPESGLVRTPWGIAQALTNLLFILTLGGALMLALPFLGDRRGRVGSLSFLVVGLFGIVVVALTARFELRHGIVFAPFIWILAPATVFGITRLAASLARRPRLRTRNATTTT